MSEERVSIKIRLKYSDTTTFQQRFAPFMSRYGMFLPMKQLKPEGSLLIFEIYLANNQCIFFGEGDVVTTYSPPQHSIPGIGIRFTALDPWSHQLLEQILQLQFPLSPLVPQLPPFQIGVLAGTGLPPADTSVAAQVPPAVMAPQAPVAPASPYAQAPVASASPYAQAPVASASPYAQASPPAVGGTRPPAAYAQASPGTRSGQAPTPSQRPPVRTTGRHGSNAQMPLFYGSEDEIPATGPIIGIDLGTTNSCCAIVENNRPGVIPSRYGYNTIPSIVAHDERGNLLVGHPAKSQMLLNPHNTVYGSKRLVGRKYHSPIVQIIKNRFHYRIIETEAGDAGVELSHTPYTLQDISALILHEIREIAQNYLQQPVYRAVISVPAYYNDNQRQAVRQAGLLAGLRVERIVNEPTAAALAYGFGRGLEQRLLVYDLGGGTFDASVLHIHNDIYEVLSTGGNTFLGGVDFDNRLIDYVVEHFTRQHGVELRDDPVKMQRIKDAAEKAKCDLSLEESTTLVVPYIATKFGQPLDIKMVITREQLNLLVEDLVEETVRVCDEVLNAQGMTPQDIDEVILVGGQTRMPLIHERLTQHFGKPPHRNVHPDEAVAIGTSLLAFSFGRSDQIRLIDVLAMSIGVGLPGGRFKPIVPRNTKLPFHKMYTIGTTRDQQTELDIVIFQGDSEYVTENEYLGTLSLKHIPPAPKGQVRFEIRFQLNNESLLTVSARNLVTNEVQEVVMTTHDTPQDLRQKLEIPESADHPGGPFGAVPPPLPSGVKSPPMAPMNAAKTSPPAKGILGWLKKL